MIDRARRAPVDDVRPVPTLTAADQAGQFVAERIAAGSDYLKIISRLGCARRTPGCGNCWPERDAQVAASEGLAPAPNGARHPDGAVFEYIETGEAIHRTPEPWAGRAPGCGRDARD